MEPQTTERQVRDALKETATVSAAAALLGVSRFTVYRLMKKYGIEVRRTIT